VLFTLRDLGIVEPLNSTNEPKRAFVDELSIP
jgi:hypothetical protein